MTVNTNRRTATDPFFLEIKADPAILPCTQDYTVQVCGFTSILELVRAIECEHDIEAPAMRLVSMGRTLYNAGHEDGKRCEDVLLHEVRLLIIFWGEKMCTEMFGAAPDRGDSCHLGPVG